MFKDFYFKLLKIARTSRELKTFTLLIWYLQSILNFKQIIFLLLLSRKMSPNLNSIPRVLLESFSFILNLGKLQLDCLVWTTHCGLPTHVTCRNPNNGIFQLPGSVGNCGWLLTQLYENNSEMVFLLLSNTCPLPTLRSCSKWWGIEMKTFLREASLNIHHVICPHSILSSRNSSSH